MHGPFWKSTTILFRFKRLLVLALIGALLSAACFGAGLTMILPTMYVLLDPDEEQSALRKVIEELQETRNDPAVRAYGELLEVKRRAEQQPPLQRLIEGKIGPEGSPEWRQQVAIWLTSQLPPDRFDAFDKGGRGCFLSREQGPSLVADNFYDKMLFFLNQKRIRADPVKRIRTDTRAETGVTGGRACQAHHGRFFSPDLPVGIDTGTIQKNSVQEG